MALPTVEERLSHSEPTWFVGGKKVFASYVDHHHDDRVGVVMAAPPGAQEQLVADRPASFYRPPYVGGRGWIGVYLDVPVDWEELEDLLEEAFRVIAPPKVVAQLDAPA